jgi:hypothetical protein
VLIYGERHLRRILTLYSLYYNETHTHLGLGKDAPLGRYIERSGTIVTTEGASTGNLQRKLACGALRPEIADLVHAELARRGEPANSN